MAVPLDLVEDEAEEWSVRSEMLTSNAKTITRYSLKLDHNHAHIATRIREREKERERERGVRELNPNPMRDCRFWVSTNYTPELLLFLPLFIYILSFFLCNLIVRSDINQIIIFK